MEKKYFTSVREELELFLANVKVEIDPLVPPTAKIKIGSLGNVVDTIFVYLSYFPNNDPSEESIDVTIEVKLGNGNGRFNADICWSNGEIIEELVDREFGYISLKNLQDQVKKMTEEIAVNVISYFQNLSTK